MSIEEHKRPYETRRGGRGWDGAGRRGGLVVIVDDDIDVFDESDVLWAMATRVQADRDLVLISGSLGAILDPSTPGGADRQARHRCHAALRPGWGGEAGDVRRARGLGATVPPTRLGMT